VLLGIDIGTTCVKGLLLAGDGRMLASTDREVPVLRPRPEWAEVVPESWWSAVAAVTAGLLRDAGVDAAQIDAMAIVAMRDPVVLLDDDGAVLRSSILWTDVRTLPQVRELCDELGAARLTDICGAIPVVGLGAPTLRWHQCHEPELWGRVARIRLVKDWIVQRLTGVDETDESSITRSMLNDGRTGSWSAELLDAAGVQAEQLPSIIRRPTDVVGSLSGTGAAALGLRPGLPVVAGGGDDPAAALGAGAVAVDSICIGTGTASDWRRVTAGYEPDPSCRCDSSKHLAPGRQIVSATIDGTGTSLRWLRDVLQAGGGIDRGDERFDALTAPALDVEPGAGGLSFFPYLGGQRAPHYLPDSSGVFFGLRAGHTPSHLVRAVLEGVAFQYPATLEILGVDPDARPPITMIDGETRSPLWNQIKADVLGLPISVPAVAEAAALGAAIVAGIGIGTFADAEDAVARAVRPGVTFIPDPARHAAYRELRERYELVHACLEPAFEVAASRHTVVHPANKHRSLHRV
jgi:xylulokinase